MNMAVIFDLDGVIIDNIPYHKQAWREMCRHYGRELTDADFDQKISGRKNDAILAFLLNRAVTDAEVQACEREKEALYRTLVQPHLQPLHGLVPLLEQLSARDIPCAIATSAPVENIDLALDGMQIRHYFDAIVDASQVKHGKPDPEVYLTAALRLKADPRQCLVFEDAPLGIRAAKAAGMRVVGITTTQRAASLHAADKIVADFSEITVAQIQALIPNSGRAG
ncbi:MAG: HAD family phosphatase [Kiritimatiellaeota bacterium]|nr:HAD family phosphatase [Kiritimatiellota bacterium]